MAISFLQSIGVVGPVKTKPNSVEVARWKVEYTVKVQDIRGQTLLSLLRVTTCFPATGYDSYPKATLLEIPMLYLRHCETEREASILYKRRQSLYNRRVRLRG